MLEDLEEVRVAAGERAGRGPWTVRGDGVHAALREANGRLEADDVLRPTSLRAGHREASVLRGRHAREMEQREAEEEG